MKITLVAILVFAATFYNVECQSPQPCRRQCQRSGFCPNSQSIVQTVIRLPSPCRACIRSTCGDYGLNSPDQVADCLYRERGRCDSCVLNEHARLIRRNCMSCIARCETGPGINRPPPPPVGPTPPGGDEISCACEGPSTCVSLQEAQVRIGSERTSCQACVNRICGSFQRYGYRSLQLCLMGARQRCSTCSQISPVERIRVRNCRECYEQCPSATDGFSTGMPPLPVPQAREGECLEVCRRQRVCPGPSQIIYTINRDPASCRDCIRAVCGPHDASNRAVVADCMFQTRESCVGCRLNAAQQAQRNRCMTCLFDCAGQGENGPEPTERAAEPPPTENTPFVVLG